MTQFSDLGLAKPLLKALAEKGYKEPTPIQAQAIPAVLKGGDLLAGAQTGTGKTAGFVLPMLQRLSEGKPVKDARGRPAIRALISPASAAPKISSVVWKPAPWPHCCRTPTSAMDWSRACGRRVGRTTPGRACAGARPRRRTVAPA